MDEAPVQVIVAAYPTPEGAGQAMADLKQGKKAGLIGIVDAAVVVKDAAGDLKVTDSRRRGTRGFVTGGVVGGVLGLLAGPAGWMALGGGAIGSLAGRARGAPLKHEMKEIGSALTPGSSALVAVIEHTWVEHVERLLAEEGARIVRDEIKRDIAAQLNAGGNVLYTAAAGPNAAGVARVAESADGTRVSGVLGDADGVFIGDAEFTDEEPAEDEDGAAAAPAAGAATAQTGSSGG